MKTNENRAIGFSWIVPLLFMTMGCMMQDDWPVPEAECASGLSPNITLKEVLDSYPGSTREIGNEWVIEGYVISSDESGNFFNTLHLQDRPSRPEAGIQIEIELRDSHLFYPPGQRVLVKLKGLFLGKTKGIFKIGSAYTSFGNLQVGRIPKHAIPGHILKTCDSPLSLTPESVDVTDLPDHPANTLVRLDNMEFAEEVLDSTFARKEEPTLRRLQDCLDNEISLLSSGYADFHQQPLPSGKGSVTAVYYPEAGKAALVVRSTEDLDMTAARCEDLITEFTSSSLIISELADPDNNSAARYVELYYAGDEPLSLNGWRLDRYTNDNTERGSSIDLSEFTISPNAYLLIASNASVFEQVYGFVPDLEGGLNSPADSNGDDNLVLMDPFGTVVDIFGVIGEDGSGTAHEFEDGRAYRKAGVHLANPVFDASEWVIYNDTGGWETVNLPQLAPWDFTPGSKD